MSTIDENGIPSYINRKTNCKGVITTHRRILTKLLQLTKISQSCYEFYANKIKSERTKDVIQMFFGFFPYKDLFTLEEIGGKYECGRQNIRRIIFKGTKEIQYMYLRDKRKISNAPLLQPNQEKNDAEGKWKSTGTAENSSSNRHYLP